MELIEKTPIDTSKPLREMFTLSSKELYKHVFERSIGILELLTMTFFYLLFIILGASHPPQGVRRAFPEGARRTPPFRGR